MYNKCVWLCVEGLYICIARYNRHYRGLYRLAHFFHTSEHYRNNRLSLEFLLGGSVLELKNYPKIIGLYQERSKHNLFNVSLKKVENKKLMILKIGYMAYSTIRC